MRRKGEPAFGPAPSFLLDCVEPAVFNANGALMHRLAIAAGVASTLLVTSVEGRSFYLPVVFFDWDKDEITPQGSATLDYAVAQYASAGQMQVRLYGYADRSGPDAYNIDLSRRRATNAYLNRRGIPDDVITIEAYGESRPLVETADGVREPQNRRVEITMGSGSGW